MMKNAKFLATIKKKNNNINLKYQNICIQIINDKLCKIKY